MSSHTDLEIQTTFQRWVDYVKSVIHVKNDDYVIERDVLLDIYANYKQATEGDAPTKAPPVWDPKGRIKHNAWANLRGKSTRQAMLDYIYVVSEAYADGTKALAT
ncbi:Acyl-coA-binding protein ACB [Mollivirus sibericum]|uniref:Acyl-coA-binding protein ACB n=1 Tax=Mollivirus sibericum TaxID=1678078 RepID=UPI0006B2EE06|nr:Acyl-coA-binding protein ACB [Mollivirus sibericum]ALD62064.1 Acyl-coA-binding protein ACB [Mollivirus sibericum]QHN71227.1 ACBP domain protein [Mollivirus kamchatka]